ncbi:MAG TPA: phosphatase PAP2 family protein [Gemmatimonadales bacterium]|jgi:undecaprenyl-diphosphatase
MRRPQLSVYSIGFLALFAIISVLVVSGTTRLWDNQALLAVATLRDPARTRIMRWLSDLGNWQWEVPLAFGIAMALGLRSKRNAARRFLAIGVSGELLYAASKFLFHRPRPTIIPHLGQAGWYSYPSGHAMLAVILWGYGLAELATIVDWRGGKMVMWLLAVVLPCAIASSRVYLGVHYPSDVLGALCLGVAWVLLWSAPPSESPSQLETSAAPSIK